MHLHDNTKKKTTPNNKPFLVLPKSLVKYAKKFYGESVDVYEDKPIPIESGYHTGKFSRPR